MTWCPLPWNHRYVATSGNLRVCTHSRVSGDNHLRAEDGHSLTTHDLGTNEHNAKPLTDMRRQMLAGEWPWQCRRCQTEQALTGTCRASYEAVRSPLTEDGARRITALDGTISADLTHSMNLHFGNVCNLKCAMCYPGESNQWYDDYVALTGQTGFVVDDHHVQLLAGVNGYHARYPTWTADETNLDKVFEIAKQARHLHIAGGEPLLNKQHWRFLERLVAAGVSQGISLEYATNATKLTPQLFALWDNFAKVQIGVSIDAYGQINDVIRYPSHWSAIENALRLLDTSRYEVYITTTVSVLAIEHIVTLFHWFDQQGFGKIRYNLKSTHAAFDPTFMSIAILSSEQRYRLFDRLRKTADALEFRDPVIQGEVAAAIDYYEMLAPTMQTTDDIPTARRQLLRFRELCQVNRHQDWEALFPVLNSYMLEWHALDVSSHQAHSDAG